MIQYEQIDKDTGKKPLFIHCAVCGSLIKKGKVSEHYSKYHRGTFPKEALNG
jgi:hypothetical protein